uniref:Uncharacterized protein n=1 Tax=Rhizophora mucronata TaxID=61149 RepID=A0A2P2QQU3_RHIMU
MCSVINLLNLKSICQSIKGKRENHHVLDSQNMGLTELHQRC